MVKNTRKKPAAKAAVREVKQSPAVMKKNFKDYYLPILTALLIVASFYIGRLSAQVEYLKKGITTGEQTVPQPSQGGAPERQLTVDALKVRAKEIGLDTNKFNQCLDGGSQTARVTAEQAEGAKLGVSGTPTFFINGIMVVGALPQSSFESVIDAELKNGGGEAAAKALGEAGTRVKMNLTNSFVTGPSNAKIKLVEFTDFQCPFCESAFPTIQALMKKYSGKISLEYKSFPLSFHENAEKSAEAALCAGEQGKFWEMHDNLFGEAK